MTQLQVLSCWLSQLLHYSSYTFFLVPPFLFNCTLFCCSCAVLYSSELTLPEPRRGTCLSPPKNLPSESSRPESLCLGDPCRAWSVVLAEAIFDPCRNEERFCEAIKSEFSEAAALSSWMVCSSSDSEGRSLKVLSSLPGASREKRRIKWGRPLVSAGLASGQAFFGSAAPLESVTAGLFVEVPLFWFTSASPNTSLSSEDCCVSLAAFGLSLAASSTLVSAILVDLSALCSRFPTWFPMIYHQNFKF